MSSRQEFLVDVARRAFVRPTGWMPALVQVTQEKFGWALAAVLSVAYTVAWVLLSPMPLQDFPTHLARAVVMDDLIFHGGTRFGDVYQYHFLLIPYVLGDLLLTSVVELLGPAAAGAFWTALVFLSFPCAVLLYLRVTGFVANGRALLFLLSLYLATDRFFLLGFMSFRLAVAMTLVTLCSVEVLRRRWSGALFATYAGVVVLGYLLHLTTAVFLAAAIGASAMLRLWLGSTRPRTEFLLLLPLAGVLAWNFAIADGYRSATDLVENPYIWGTLHSKFARLGSAFLRYRTHADELLVFVLAGCVLLASGPLRREQLKNPMVLEVFALAVTFLALYFILPISYSDAWYVDVRSLPLFSLFLILGFLGLAAGERSADRIRMPHAVALAALLASGNLIMLVNELAGKDAWLAQYRTVVAAIPAHARVFPIYAQPITTLAPFLHANSFVTIDRAGTIPYEFAADNGSTVRYFRYRHRPYDPWESWYAATSTQKIDWQRVACDYDYLLITRPFEPGRVALPTRTVAQNGSAALFAIDKQPCTR